MLEFLSLFVGLTANHSVKFFDVNHGVLNSQNTSGNQVISFGANRAITSIEVTTDFSVFSDNLTFSYPDLADFDGDGDIDIADYFVILTNLHTNVIALTTAQSSLLGDLTADLRIDGRDF